MVRKSLVAYSATPPASTVDAPMFLGPRSSRQPAVGTWLWVSSADVTDTTVGAQPRLRSSPLLQTRGVHAAQFLLQVGDLVANAAGEFELQVPRGGHHLRGHLLDEVGEFGARHVGRVASLDDSRADRATALARCAPTTGGVAAGAAHVDRRVGVVGLAVHLVEDVGDLLAKRLRVDPVLH